MKSRWRVLLAVGGVLAAFLASDLRAQIAADTARVGRGYRPYDQPIDPDRYLIRPGEELEIIFVKTKLPNLNLYVNAEGRIVDRSLGVIDLAGQTLTQARDRLRPELARLYNADEIVITVSNIYPVAIQVSGLVNRPGVYVGFTSQTARELIDSAGGLADGASSRRISFIGGPKPLTIDLDRALYGGELEFDPCLYAGFRIEVPAQGDVVVISGEDFGPRAIELFEDDSLERLVTLAGGRVQDLKIEDSRLLNDPQRDLQSNGVRTGDRIWVPSVGRTAGGRGEVQIVGEVAVEGRYELRDGWTVSDLVAAAGGLTPEANRRRIVVFRHTRPDDPGPQVRYPLWSTASGAEAVSLEPIDSVYVPALVDYVGVDGLVMRPGYYPYREGLKVADYIQMAGGFSQRADRERVQVLDRVSGISRTLGPNDPVVDGDRIIVKEALDPR